MFGEGPPGKFLSLSVAESSGSVALMCTAFNMQTKHGHNWIRLPLVCLTFECRKSNKFIQEKLIKEIKIKMLVLFKNDLVSGPAFTALAKVLFGQAPAKGQLPVTIKQSKSH